VNNKSGMVGKDGALTKFHNFQVPEGNGEWYKSKYVSRIDVENVSRISGAENQINLLLRMAKSKAHLDISEPLEMQYLIYHSF
jgi:hypothetical protein